MNFVNKSLNKPQRLWGFQRRYVKGTFNNHMDKLRGGGGQKMSVFVHAQGIKTVKEGSRGSKMAKFCPHSLLNDS